VSRELLRAFFVGALRKADEEVILRFADIAAIDRTGRLDVERRWKESDDCRADGIYFAFACGCAGVRENCTMLGEDRGVFNKG